MRGEEIKEEPKGATGEVLLQPGIELLVQGEKKRDNPSNCNPGGGGTLGEKKGGGFSNRTPWDGTRSRS